MRTYTVTANRNLSHQNHNHNRKKKHTETQPTQQKATQTTTLTHTNSASLGPTGAWAPGANDLRPMTIPFIVFFRDPSTFSGDWRHSYVGFEGPVVPYLRFGTAGTLGQCKTQQVVHPGGHRYQRPGLENWSQLPAVEERSQTERPRALHELTQPQEADSILHLLRTYPITRLMGLP